MSTAFDLDMDCIEASTRVFEAIVEHASASGVDPTETVDIGGMPVGDIRNIAGAMRAWLEFKRNPGSFSDGYHTVDELYDHRVTLWIALCRVSDGASWRSRLHSDGTSFPGFFMLGMLRDWGNQITYHLPDRYWGQTEFAETLERGPEFDGHTSQDVLQRLGALQAIW